ncbi:MAG: SDR family NAD(P)-dependent oxidoreductase [Terriglobia bacterium]
MKLQGKIAIITGAGTGIGRAIATSFAQEGAAVVLAGRTEARLLEVANAIQSSGGQAFPIRADVSNPLEVQNLVDAATRHFGKINILVNNAGVFIYKNLMKLTIQEWDDTINTNLKGTFLCCQAVLPGMIEQKQGNIINISSIHGKIGDANLAAHCASKFGVIGFTQALAKEVIEHNINVNVICPGQVSSRWVEEESPTVAPLLTRLRPADVAGVAVFLASPDSSIMTGATIDVFGGTTVKIH